MKRLRLDPDLGPPSDDEAEENLDRDQRSHEDKRCRKCGEIRPRKILIECTQCTYRYHKTCVKVLKKQAEKFAKFICKPCRDINGPNNDPPNAENPTSANFDLLLYLQTCKSNVSMLGNIPKGARVAAAEALIELIDNVIQSNTPLSWSKLLCFPYHGLQKPKKEKPTPNSPSLVTKIKNNISVFMNSSFPPDRFPFQLRNKAPKPKTREEILKNRVDAKFAENDIRGAIRELSSEDTLAPDNNETLEKLQEKHPAAPTGISLPAAVEDSDAHIPASTNTVKAAILSFPAGSAGGPDGLKPGHLKNLIGAWEAGKKLLDSLCNLCNFVLKYEIPEDVRPIFFGANLCAFSKRDNGIRPIAVGTTFRRLITKTGLKSVSRGLGTFFRPNQLGYSSKGGCEAAVHAARHYITSNPLNKVFLKLDIKNAFNCINRDIFLQRVKEKIPSLFNLFLQAYSNPSHLFYRDKIISSETGLQQGDPGGPALFSLGIDHIVNGIKSEVNLWYLDDSNIADSPQVVLKDLQFIITELNKIGLTLNSSKCELICMNLEESESVINKFENILPNLKVTSIENLMILGAPVSAHGVRVEIQSKLNALERMISKLDLIDPHQAFILLKNSFVIPKMT